MRLIWVWLDKAGIILESTFHHNFCIFFLFFSVALMFPSSDASSSCILEGVSFYPFISPLLRFRRAAQGGCYLRLDWISFRELLVLSGQMPVRTSHVSRPFFFHSLIDDLITASCVFLQTNRVFLAFSFTPWGAVDHQVTLNDMIALSSTWGEAAALVLLSSRVLVVF